MALKNTDVSAEYPYVFLIEQAIYQKPIYVATASPIYSISIAWKNYKITDDGTVIYDQENIYTFSDDNFYGNTILAASQGDMVFAQALGAQQVAIKKIIEDELHITLEEV